MNYLQNLALKLVEELDDLKDFEEVVEKVASEVAVALARGICEAIDDKLAEERDKDLRMVGFRTKTVVAKFGLLKLRRRLYREGNGKYRYLLDETLGLEGAFSPSLEKASLILSSEVSFRKAAQVISLLLPKEVTVSHGKLHALIREVGKMKEEQEKEKRASLFEEGLFPKSAGKKVERLFIEADGVGIALQKEAERRGEVKLAISYEGWEEKGKNQKSLREKQVQAAFEEGESFWQKFYASLFEKYDLLRVKDFVLGGDGASWIKKAKDTFPNLTFELSKFHILKSLKWAFGSDEERIEKAYKAALTGSVEALEDILLKAEKKKKGKARKRIRLVKAYLLGNKEALSDWRMRLVPKDDERGLGAIEGNIDKVLANRFKKRGMRWSKNGANAMAKVISLRENKELSSFLSKKREKPKLLKTQEVVEKVRGEIKKDPEAWLKVRLPAFSGPHSSRPWVKALRELTRIEVAC
jgi:hypothetical protein